MKRSNRSPLWRRPVASEVDEELEMHLDLRTKEYEAQGMSPKEARRKALERFGDIERHAAECRREADVRNRRWRVATWLAEMHQDLRFAWRRFGKPVYVLVTRRLLRTRDGEERRPSSGPWPEWSEPLGPS